MANLVKSVDDLVTGECEGDLVNGSPRWSQVARSDRKNLWAKSSQFIDLVPPCGGWAAGGQFSIVGTLCALTHFVRTSLD